MTRFLITGASGMLGRDLEAALVGRDVTALSRTELDIADGAAALAAVAGHDVVINAAAYTKVDDAETHEDDARRVNALGAASLASAAAQHGALLVQVSTDYVFDGSASTPYSEDAPLAPVSAYGRTKAEGERLVRQILPDDSLIVRTAWLYGEHGPNFASTMLRLAGDRDTLSVVDDQRGQPTWTHDLAEQIVRLVDSGARTGIFHGTSSGETTWFGFAQAVFDEAGLDPARITPTDSASFIRPAPRPAYSVLGHGSWEKVGLAPLPDWRESLRAAWSAGAIA
ncbi:dTDP-4-dehydrorhamnose reductase [Microcella alkalica]|uniref:dTDP-4-dehydrorhamnose reductase n=1 Tax=Microcella alkalica TaxID=355930 RepID=A0A839EEW2_9MICO|nr:dTDP-4-dehydrorhamnose reductase [Microcella alkalica]MBA8848932.1 dTDP-4-dehydrorhamnose reductase [Microcella alkalica]